EHHLTQASMEIAMWNQTYKNHECEFTGILRTKGAWRENSGPSYDYKYRSKEEAYEVAKAKAELLKLCLASDASYYPDPKYRKFVGQTSLGESPEIVEVTLKQEFESAVAEEVASTGSTDESSTKPTTKSSAKAKPKSTGKK